MPFRVRAHFIKQSQVSVIPASRSPDEWRRTGTRLIQALPAKNCVWGGDWKIEFLSKIEAVRGEIRPPLYH